MASSYSTSHFEDPSDDPLPHPYLREPKLFVSGLAPNARKEDLAEILRYCIPFRPNIPVDEQGRALPGFIEFKELAAAEKALATLQNRPLPHPAPPCNIVLSPFPPTSPPTSLPPPQALPRLVKQLPIGVTDAFLYDLFRPFGPLANVRSEAGFGPDIGVVEFWREEDARRAEEAMHCAEVGNQNISIQVYQPRRAPGAHTDFSASAPPFVPASQSSMYPQQQQQTGTAQQNVSQPPSNYLPSHLFAIPPPVTPQPFGNILSLSSPAMNSYPSLPPPPSHLSPPHSPQLGMAQTQLSYGAVPQQPSYGSSEMYGMTQQQQPTFASTSSPPPYHHPSPPITPQRNPSAYSPMYPSPLSSPRSSPGGPGQGLGGSPSTTAYSPFSLPYNTPPPPHPHASLFYSPPGGSSPYSRSPPGSNGAFVHGPGQQVQYAPSYGPGAGSHSGLIDPCNLFIKNLDVNIDSNELFTHFRQFGSIVSARVMRTETGQSRGFGFVSFQSPEQASSALAAMNGVTLGTKPIIVRLHEPKQLRQEKLATRYGGRTRSPHPRSASGATSPSPSDAGGDVQSPLDRTRRSSGSYYHAALAGTLNVPIRYEELSALSPVVRREVLTGELTRKLKSLDTVPPTEIDSYADAIAALSLNEAIESIHNPDSLVEQVNKLQGIPEPLVAEPQPTVIVEPAATEPSPAAAEPSSLSSTPAPPASAPEHPSTPLSVAASLEGPPRTASPAGSLPAGSEKDKLLAAVSRLDAANAPAIIELLLGLSKKERAMCLFNSEYLKAKVAEAKAVLDADDDTEATASVVSTVPAVAATPSKGNGAVSLPDVGTPDLIRTSTPSSATPDVPGTPNVAPATVHTLASLAKLPAAEIIKLASSPNATGLPLPKADPEVIKSTDDFIDGLNGQSEQQKKQQVGTKLFKVVKAFGVRNVGDACDTTKTDKMLINRSQAKVTIHLLDTEDLRALAHLMNSYPSVLKEKVLQATAAASK